MDDITTDIKESQREEFKEEFHISPDDAAVLFRDGSPLVLMLQGMYFDEMEALRECDMKQDGQRLQGQAQVLWSLLSIPARIAELKNTE